MATESVIASANRSRTGSSRGDADLETVDLDGNRLDREQGHRNLVNRRGPESASTFDFEGGGQFANGEGPIPAKTREQGPFPAGFAHDGTGRPFFGPGRVKFPASRRILREAKSSRELLMLRSIGSLAAGLGLLAHLARVAQLGLLVGLAAVPGSAAAEEPAAPWSPEPPP